jgi:hypothetical protein
MPFYPCSILFMMSKRNHSTQRQRSRSVTRLSEVEEIANALVDFAIKTKSINLAPVPSKTSISIARETTISDACDTAMNEMKSSKCTKPSASSSEVRNNYHAVRIRLSSLSRPPPPPPLPACHMSKRQEGNDGDFHPVSTNTPCVMSNQLNDKKRLNIHHYTEPSPLPPPFSDKRDLQLMHPQKLIAKRFAALSSIHSRPSSRQRAGSVERGLSSRRASSGSDRGRQHDRPISANSKIPRAGSVERRMSSRRASSSKDRGRQYARPSCGDSQSPKTEHQKQHRERIAALWSSHPHPRRDENGGLHSDRKQMRAISPNKGNSIVSEQKFDPNTGRCKKHPSIILAKKSTFRNEWDVIKVCPHCNKARQHKLQQDDSGGGDADQNHRLDDSYASLGNNSMTNTNDDIHSVSVAASSTTFKTTTSDGSSKARRRRSLGPAGHISKHSITSAKDTTASSLRVSLMPYTTPRGDIGWYSGTVTCRGTPHGQGEMRSKTGHVIAGVWTNGCFDDEKLERRSGCHSKDGEADQNRKLSISYTSLGSNSTKKATDDISAVSVAATSTFCKRMTTDGSSSGARRRRSLGSAGHFIKQSIIAANDTASLRVSRMLYTTPSGENGWYTGMVNYRGLPHGQGEMRTKTGNVIEGMWTDGNSLQNVDTCFPGLVPNSTTWSSNHHSGGIYCHPLASIRNL